MTSSTTATRPADTRRHNLRRLGVLGSAMLAGLLTWVVEVPVLGLELLVGTGASVTTVGPASVLVAALVAGGAGWLTLALLERATAHGRRVWTLIAGVVLGLSLLGPLGGGSGGVIAGLMALHLVVGLTILLGLRGRR